MTREAFILKFLDKNYKVIADTNDFAIIDLLSFGETKFHSTYDFLEEYNKIIGRFITSDEIFDKWFNSKKRIIAKKLTDCFDVMDGSLGSVALLRDLFNKFENNIEFNQNFIRKYFDEFYTEKYLRPKLKEYTEKFDINLDSGKLLDNFYESLYIENDKQHDFAIDYLNKWYTNTVLTDRVNDFLSQLVITLGRTNWVVTWVGHGPVIEDTLKKQFHKENQFQYRYIVGMYEEWYEREVLDASERIIKKNRNL